MYYGIAIYCDEYDVVAFETEEARDKWVSLQDSQSVCLGMTNKEYLPYERTAITQEEAEKLLGDKVKLDDSESYDVVEPQTYTHFDPIVGDVEVIIDTRMVFISGEDCAG